jgi:hypothetical protein
LRGNEGTLHAFNNCKVMANLELTTLVVIFIWKIVELLGHYTLDEVAIGLELFVFGLVKTCNMWRLRKIWY